jgi:hypothetical protein
MPQPVHVTHFNCLVPTGRGQPGVLRVPIAGEDGAAVRSKLLLTLIRPAHVPQLHTAVFRNRRECVRIVGAELDVSHALRVAVKDGDGVFQANVEVPHCAVLGARNKPVGLAGVEIDFVDGAFVLLVVLLLHCFAHFGEIPDAHVTVCGGCGQVMI